MQKIINISKNEHPRIISKLKEPFTALAIFVIAVILFFLPALTRAGFFGGDFLFSFPLYFNKFAELKDLGLAQWNPNSFGGIPLLASAFLYGYLPNWLTIFLINNDINFSYLVMESLVIAHIIIAAFSFFLLARYFKISFAGAIVSGLIFSLSSFLVYKAMYFSLIYSTAWFPLIFLFFHRGLNRNKWRDIVIAGFFMVLSILASYIQITYYIGLFLFFYTIFFVFSRYYKTNTSYIKILTGPFLKLAAVALMVLGASAIIIIPVMDYIKLTWHGNIANPVGFQLSPVYFIFNQLLPHYFGGLAQMEIYQGNWSVIEFQTYIGPLALILSFIAIIVLFKKNNDVKFLAAATIAYLVISFGVYSPLYWILYFILPFFSNLTTPSKFWLFAVFAMSLLAGFGLDIILEKTKNDLYKRISVVTGMMLKSFLIIASVLALLGIYQSGNLIKNSLPIQTKNFLNSENIIRDYLILFVLITISYMLFKRWFNDRIKRSIFSASVIILVFLDLFLAGFSFNYIDSINPEEYYQKPAEIDFLENQDKTNYRFAINNQLNDSIDVLYGIPGLDQVSISTLRYDEFTEGYYSDIAGSMGITHGNRLNLLNARYMLFPDSPKEGNYRKIPNTTNLYENLDALPRLFLTHNTETTINKEDILKRIDSVDFDPKQTLILEKSSPLANTSSSNDNNNKDTAVFTYYSPDKIDIYTYSLSPSMLFLSEMYYPGWKATIDGKPAEIYLANYLFRSVYLDKGPHSIKMVFEPEDFKLGRNITLVTLFVMLAYFVYDIARNRKLEGLV